MGSWTESSVVRGVAGATAAVLLAAGLTVVGQAVAPVAAQAAQDPTVCAGSVSLVNGGFEQPTVSGNYQIVNESVVPGWSTTATDKMIELWRSGFQGVPAAAGNQFAELNANQRSMLYQDVATTPGQTLTWSLKHRGRSGTDVMRVRIGAPGAPTSLPIVRDNMADGNTAWGAYTGTYTVPPGQTTTRFGFEAVSSAGGNASVGNFLDDITFGTGPCLISSKSVTNVTRGGTTAEVGDVLRYTVTTRNDGGNPATQVSSGDVIQAGQEFVPGSLRIAAGAGAGALTDAAGDDRAEYVSGDRSVRFRLGDGGTAAAGGSLAAGASATYTFDTRVTLAGADTTIRNEALVSFRDLDGQERTSRTNETTVPVGPAADLRVTKTLDTSPLVAGRPVTFTIRATNAGPQIGTGVTVTDTLPAGLTQVSATTAGGDCTVSGSTVSCAMADLAVGADVPITISGVLSPDFPSGSALHNTVTIAGDRFDPDRSNNTAGVNGILSASADLSIQKVFAPEAPVAGENLTYTLTVRNDGPSDAQDVTITDPLDPDTTFVSATPAESACTVTDGTVRCALGTVPAGEERSAVITVTLAPGATAVVQNTATVTSSTNDPDPSNNASSTSFEPIVIADLAVVKTASVEEVAAGGTFDYTIVVRNLGSSAAQNAVLDDVVPAGLTITGVNGTADCAVQDGTALRCAWDTLSASETSTIVLSVQVDPDAPEGTLTNTASVAAPADDQDTSNNSDSADVRIVQSADLSVQKLHAGDPVPGSRSVYTISYRNNGPSTARGAVITDVLPAGFTPGVLDTGCTVTDGVVSCALGDLAPGAGAEIHIEGAWDQNLTGTVSNTAAIESATPDPDENNNTSTVENDFAPSADLSIVKTAVEQRFPHIGGPVEYDVVVRNDGPSVAQDVVVDEQPSAGVTISGAEPSRGVWDAATARWLVGPLAPGESATLRVTGTFAATGDVANTAVVTSGTPDPDPEDNTSTAVVPVIAAADISVVKTADVNRISAGGTITYTLTVRNNGPSTAEVVNVFDLPSNGLVDLATTTPECTAQDRSVDCTLVMFEAGAEFTATITARVDPETTDFSVLNEARVVSPVTYDPNGRNDSSMITTIIERHPALELVKTPSAPVDVDGDGRIGAGDAIDYTFTVRNTGDVPLHDVTVTDALLGGAVDCPELSGATIGVAESVSCAPVRYLLTQDDVNGGTVHNVATASGTDPVGAVVTDEGTADTTIPSVNAISLVKQAGSVVDANGDGLVSAGDTVDYSFTVRNTGTTTLTNPVVTDEMLGGEVLCPDVPAELAPGAEAACGPITYTLTQDDVDQGVAHNVATVIADAPRGTVTDEAEATVRIDGTDAIELVKTPSAVRDVNGDGLIGAGDAIDYVFAVRNIGSTTLEQVTIRDPLLSAGPLCGVSLLTPGSPWTCGRFTHTLTQADIEAGLVHNTARVDGTGSIGPVSDESSADVVITGFNGIELTKDAGAPVDADGDGRIGAGDRIDYTFTLRNSGTTILRDLVLSDPLLGGVVDCPALDGAELSPGDSLSCGPVAYTLTQADLDAGAVHNAATATGRSTSGPATDRDTADVPLPAEDGVELIKDAGAPVDATGDGRIGAGDTVAYTFTVRNTGTTTLTGIVLTDPLLGGAVTCPELDGAALAPGQAVTCAPVTYTLTQEDVDRGTVHNTAEATATAPGGRTVTDDDTADVTIPAVDGLGLEKAAGTPVDANGDGRIGAGDTIEYTFTVRNTGTTTITDVRLSDPLLGGELACDALAGVALSPGDQVVCGSVAYALTQDDVERGSVHNEASVTGTAPDDRPVSGGDDADVSFVPVAAVELDKTAREPADANGDGRIGAGDTVDFSFRVVNTGTVRLSGLELRDGMLGGAIDCPALEGAVLDPGAAIDCGPVTHTLTQADVDAGAVHNVAEVSGDSVRGPVSDEDAVDVALLSTSGIALDKVAGAPVDTDGDGVLGAGDTVAYTFTVHNTGTTTLTDVVVTDPMLGGEVACAAIDGPLAPGASVTCAPVVHTLTQGDIDGGVVHNEASVSATSPQGPVDDDAQADVAIDGADAIGLTKSVVALVDLDGDGRTGAGDAVDYAFTVRNLGTTTLTDPELSDPLLGGALECPALDGATLAPGASVDCGPIRYLLTQEDVERGTVHNEAVVTATGPRGTVSDDAAADVAITGETGIALVKTAGAPTDADGDGRIGAGDTVAYTFTVTNTGTTTLTGVAITDPLLGGPVACDALGDGTLAPGASVTCAPVAYPLTQADVDAGTVHNEATASGTGGGAAVSDRDTADVAVHGTDGLALEKTAGDIVDANGSGRVDAGDTVVFSFTVTNTGTTTLHGIAVTDARLDGDVVCDPTTLAPGESVTCTGPAAVLTQAEVDAGAIVNTATATGDGSGTVTVDDTVTVPIDAPAAVTLEKSGGDYVDANRDGAVSAGDTVAFRFRVVNTGAVTVTGLTIEDALLGGTLDCAIPALAPGQSAECGPIVYRITAAEAARGIVDNTATVHGSAGDDPVSGTDSVRLDLPVLAITGAVIAGLPWAIGLLLLGGIALLVSILLRRRRSEA
ncbi:DUF7507 domain-containing protein [Microbacterium resistens]|uniref:DUF7507 domain-containing protein n=1 Tax=Microbacterium resistens TaxID=156977 RepID=UPI001C568B0B|nr:DUF11 domain-containing protein [Microbacterium resistens]